jgi:hypothetical protein
MRQLADAIQENDDESVARLESSRPTKSLSGCQWAENREKILSGEIIFHDLEYKKEVTSVHRSNEWLAGLRQALDENSNKNDEKPAKTP